MLLINAPLQTSEVEALYIQATALFSFCQSIPSGQLTLILQDKDVLKIERVTILL